MYHSGEEDGCVIMLWVALAGGVEQLLPVAEVAQGNASVPGHLGTFLLVLHQKHPHHHQAHGILETWVGVDLGSHGHHGQEVVLLGEVGTDGQGIRSHRCLSGDDEHTPG